MTIAFQAIQPQDARPFCLSVQVRSIKPAHAERLQKLVRDISGLNGLTVRVRPPPPHETAAVEKPPVEREPVAEAAPSTRLGRLQVVLSERDSYVMDSAGNRFRKGDVIEGFTIAAIRLDQVQFVRHGTRYLVNVATLL